MKRKNSYFNLLTGPQQTAAVLGAGLVLFLLGVLAAPYVPRLRDFDQTFYPAARYLLAGQNPYTAYYQETDQGAPPAFFSPPWLMPILVPFGLLPLELARAEWMIFLIVMTCLGIHLLAWWGLKGPAWLLLAALPWSLIGLLFGQVTVLVFLGAVLAIRQIAVPGRGIKSVLLILLGLALVGLKPQLGVSLGASMILWLLWRRDPRWPLIVGGGIIFLLLVWLISPPWPIIKASSAQDLIAPLWKSTLERELTLWQQPLWLAWPVRGLVVAVMLLWAWRARDLTPAWWSAMLAATLIITPYSRAYDGVLLLPILGQLIARHRLRAGIFLVIVVAYTSLPLGELGSVVTSLTAWLLFVPWPELFARRQAEVAAL